MLPERLEQIKPLIAAALAKPAAERESFLRQICGDDFELRRDIDSFLRHKSDTDPDGPQAETIPNVHVSFENPSAQVTVQIPADPRIGKQFGKYLIRSLLAEGGMGIVYLAIDTQLGREVALKVLPEYFSMDRERVSRFRREARATSLLNHPNIVTVFEIGQMDQCEFIVTEYVEGRTLRDLMRQGQVPFIEILKIGSQVAGALATAHKAGIVHRDIKPENVMIRPDGYVKVLDFGLAKLSDSTRKTASGDIEFSLTNKTTPGMIMGTVSYMSPEQAEGKDTDPRTDIWALGVMLYEMVAGKVPFRGPTSSHTIVAIIEQDPDQLDHASPELRQLISTALQKDRALRFQTAAAMASAIDEVKHRLGYVSDQNISSPAHTTERMVSVPVSVASMAPKPATSPFRKLFWILPATAVILLVGSVAVFAIAGWLLDFGRDSQNATIDNTSVPTPAATLTPTSVVPTPEPTAQVTYVEPTPVPTATPAPEITPERSTPKPVVDRPAPQPKRTPRQTQRPKQDPNCVFTNTC